MCFFSQLSQTLLQMLSHNILSSTGSPNTLFFFIFIYNALLPICPVPVYQCFRKGASYICWASPNSSKLSLSSFAWKTGLWQRCPCRAVQWLSNLPGSLMISFSKLESYLWWRLCSPFRCRLVPRKRDKITAALSFVKQRNRHSLNAWPQSQQKWQQAPKLRSLKFLGIWGS